MVEFLRKELELLEDILQEFFDVDVITLIPPGNVYCEYTVDAAQKYGIKYINCQTDDSVMHDVKIMSNNNVFAFHDKEIVEEGLDWFEDKLKLYKKSNYVFVKELNCES